MKLDVKSAVVDILIQENIEYVFGHTGGHIMHLWEAVENAKINIIFNKQEGNAVYMADGYTRITKKPGIILGTAGPGATNMTTGLATAYLDSIPLIAICATVPTFVTGRNPIQDGSGRGWAFNQKVTMSSVCKKGFSAVSPEDVPKLLREAFRVALSGRKGPVYIEIPSDFWGKEIDYESIKPFKYRNTNIPLCNPDHYKVITKELFSAKNPLIIIGEGAEEENIEYKLKRFLEKVKIPFGVSPIAKSYVDEFDDLFLGVMKGRGKTQKIYEYMRKSDFILFLGDRMQHWEMNWHDDSIVKNARLAQIDIDPDEIGRVYPIDYSVVGSVSSYIDSVEIEHKNAKLLLQSVNELKKLYPRKDVYEDNKGFINSLNIVNIVEKLASKDAVIVTDTGNAKSLSILKYRTGFNQYFITADNNGPMGYAIPASFGASIAIKKEVICFVGDGGFQMSCNELGLALNYDLKVIFIVFNNGGCFSIKKSQISAYGKSCATDFKNPDFLKIAESYNINGYKVEESQEFEKVFKEAQKSISSSIIEVIVNDDLIIWE